MKKLFFILFCLSISGNLFAQNGIIQFNQSISFGINNKYKKSIQTNDGGYVAIHRAYYDGDINNLIKLNSSFDSIWTTSLATPYSTTFEDVIQLEDSSFILCGTTNSDLKILKISSNGTIIWDKTFGGSGSDEGKSIVKINNGNVLILGTTTSTDGDILNKSTVDQDVLLIEVSPFGSIVTQKLYGGSGNDKGFSILKLSNGQGFVLNAQTFSYDGMVSGNHGTEDFWVVRIDNSYNFIWGTCIGGSYDDLPSSMAQNSDSTVIITGTTYSSDYDFTRSYNSAAIAISSVNLSGQKVWSKSITSPMTSPVGSANMEKVVACENGSFILAGSSFGILPEASYADGVSSEAGIIYKLDADGNTIWSRCIGGDGWDWCYDIIKNNSGNYVICGERHINSNNGDYKNAPNIQTETGSFILELKNLNSIKGYVYVDSNNNSIKDTNEEYFNKGFVTTIKTDLSMQTDLSDGKFLFGVDTGSYYTSAYFQNSYPDYDPAQFRILPKKVLSNIVGNSQTDTVIFRVVPIQYFDDVEITSLIPDTIQTGSNFPATIYFKNNLNKPVDSVKIKIIFSPSFTIVSSSPNIDYSLGDTSFWVKTSVGPLAQDSISFILRSNLPPLSSAVIKGVILPFESDYDTSNNTLNKNLFIIEHFDEVEITSRFPDTIPTGLNFPATIYLKNNLNQPIDSVKIKIKFNPTFSVVSSSPAINYSLGDTSFWLKNNFAPLAQDSINLILRSNLPPLYSNIAINGIILPFESDYDTSNNKLNKNIFIAGQNAYIQNTAIDISSNSNAGKGRVMPYEIIYHFESNLDTTRIVLRLIKDSKSVFISAIPPITSIVGNTLQWNITSLNLINGDTIKLQLKINDSSNVQIGDTIKHLASISFITVDTFALSKADTIQQIINVVCSPTDSTNTTLTAPQGIQWLRTLGGNKSESISGTAICNDSSFVVVGSTNSIDGDFSANTSDSTNGFIVKYNTNGMVIWKKTFGGNKTDALGAVVRNTDGTFIAAGITNSNNGDFSTNHGGDDVWILKLDSNGNTLWQKLIGGSNDDEGYIIKPTADGGYIFIGNTESVDGDIITNPYPNSVYGRSWAMKLNATGNIVWQQFFADSVFSEANDVIQTWDGGYILAGAAPDGSVYSIPTIASIVKMDKDGNIVYCKKQNIPEHFTIYSSVIQNIDSSYLLTGTIHKSFDSDTTCIGLHSQYFDLLISKLDKNGNASYNKYFGGTESDWGLNIRKSNDGGYLVAGYTSSMDGNVSGYHESLPSLGYKEDDGWILKLDSATNIVWQKTIGGNEFDKISSVLQFPNNDIFVTGSTSSKNNGDIFNYKGGDLDAFLGKIGTANFIRGYVFSDQNGDGIKQPSENYFNSGYVSSNKGSLVSGSTIDQGFYANSVDTGIYITKISTSRPYYSSNPVADTSIFISYLQTDTINFAMSPIPGIKDLNITLIPLNPARPGFATQYQIKYENVGTTAISNGNVKFVKGNNTVFDSSSVAPSNITADTLSWNFTNFSPLESKTITVYLHLLPPPQNNNGDTLVLSATISPVISDSTPLNNISTINQLVTGSFDPNLKTETHGGILTNEQILDGEYLNYVIYFQNTGTDTAFRVVIRDTLNNSVDWKSFEMISTSHLSTLSISDSNKLEWKFDPIILPDSNHNEIESHGFVAFKIKPKSTISAGNLITNKASIYFDFNLPIETNNNSTFVSTESFICPGSNTYFPSNYPGNHTYQWQFNNGSGYSNLNNNGIFNGVNNDTLKLSAPPTSFYGYKFRCIIDGNLQSDEYYLKFATRWKGSANSAWENPLNWSCGTLPDYNTDVIINSDVAHYPEINANSGCRSIKCKAGSYILIKTGVQFILNGKL